jgi:hypothetical protein
VLPLSQSALQPKRVHKVLDCYWNCNCCWVLMSSSHVQGNLALKVAMDLQTPVRVCRAAGMQVRDGHSYRLYAYEGLYLVRDMV